jgi:glucose-1-phosphate adenylyltransferase
MWPINTGTYYGSPARIIGGNIRNSLISEGTVVNGAKIRNSIIRSGVTIEKGASVEDCIIMDNVVLRKNCKLKRIIVDKSNIVEEGDEIGFNHDVDRFRCHIDPSGICILPKGGRKTRRTK